MIFEIILKNGGPQQVNLIEWSYLGPQSVSKSENLTQMNVFINMVITRAKNRSPDMILKPFDGKLNEKKNEIPPRACRP